MAKHDGSKNDELNKLNGGEVIALPHRKPLQVIDPYLQLALINNYIEINKVSQKLSKVNGGAGGWLKAMLLFACH